MTEVYVISHHEGLIAVAATEDLTNRIRDGFVSDYGHKFGMPWVECVQVQNDREVAR